MNNDIVMTVSDFVAVFNQTIEYVYPSVSIVGELSNFRISKNKWVYFDLKDEYASVKFFGIVYQMPGPLEDGLMVEVKGAPRLHHQFGFSITVQNLRPVGEGSLKKAASLLEAQLTKEGLFSSERKRSILIPPKSVGLITSGNSAAYHDFIKILNTRWGGVEVFVADVQVQGDVAPMQIVRAIEYFNTHQQVDVLVITRGGGSTDDLSAFNTEQVTRAVGGSRNPTIVAIGHEVDISLAELAADLRASTPSNAAELLVPDRQQQLQQLHSEAKSLLHQLTTQIHQLRIFLLNQREQLHHSVVDNVNNTKQSLMQVSNLVRTYDLNTVLARGYAVVRMNGRVVSSVQQATVGNNMKIALHDGQISGQIIAKKRNTI